MGGKANIHGVQKGKLVDPAVAAEILDATAEGDQALVQQAVDEESVVIEETRPPLKPNKIGSSPEAF